VKKALILQQQDPMKLYSNNKADRKVVKKSKSVLGTPEHVSVSGGTLSTRRAVVGHKSDEFYAKSRPREPIYMCPPAYKQQIIRSWRIRCNVSANGSTQTVSSFNLASLLGVFAITATTSAMITESFRIRRFRMWSWTQVQGVGVDIEIKLSDATTAGGQSGPPCTIGDSSASISTPAFVEFEIPSDSIFARWQDVSSANSFFSYYSPQTAILDIDFEFIIDDVGSSAAGPAITGATAGNIYHKNIATLTAVAPLNSIP